MNSALQNKRRFSAKLLLVIVPVLVILQVILTSGAENIVLFVAESNVTTKDNITLDATGADELDFTFYLLEAHTPLKSLKFQSKDGKIDFPIMLDPEVPGTHKFTLTSRFTKEIIAEEEVEVALAEIAEETVLVENKTNKTAEVTNILVNTPTYNGSNNTINQTEENATREGEAVAEETLEASEEVQEEQATVNEETPSDFSATNETVNETITNETIETANQITNNETKINETATQEEQEEEPPINEEIQEETHNTTTNETNINQTTNETIISDTVVDAEENSLSIRDSKFQELLADIIMYENSKQEGEYDVEINNLGIENTVNVKLNKLNFSGNLTLKIEEVKKKIFIERKESVKTFAIDPSALDFEDGEVTRIATGTELWKCKDWNFTNQECLGEWKKIMDLTPGELYTININATDPGFGEIWITDAMHLDENRTFISDIFDEVKALDGSWSETIPSGNYVRVTFEQNLTSEKDITLYPRTISGSPRVEVYEIDESEIVAEFTSLNENAYNKVFLAGLQGSQDTFDLKILEGDVQFDHIIDPTSTDTADSGTFTNTAGTGTPINVGSFTDTQVDDDTEWRFGYQDGAGQANVDFEIELAFNVSSLNITGSQIINISVTVRSCWTGGTGSDCGVVDQPEFNDGTNGEFRVYLEGADTELLDCTSAQCEPSELVLLGDFDTDPAWGTAYTENVFQFQKLSGFEGGDIVGDFLNITLRTNGTNHNVNFEVEQRVDYVSLTIGYNVLPTTPTNITCDDSDNCNVSITNTVELNASGSTDSDGDAITYFIEASLDNITTIQNTSNFSHTVGDEGITFVSATEAGTGSAAANLAINVPAGVVEDDFLLLFGVTADGDDGGFDVLTGWTEIEDAAVFLTGGSAPSPPGMSVWTRIASSSEPSSYTITPTFGSTGISAQMIAFRGVDTTTPLDVTQTTATGDSTNANPPTIGSGSSTDGYMTVIGSFHDSTSITSHTVPSGYTDPNGQGRVVGSGGGNGNTLGIAYRTTTISPPAAEDPAAFTTSTEQWGAITVALRPATGTLNETNTSYITYENVNSDYANVTNITITVEVDSYNPEASVNQSTNKPDLEVEVYNGSEFISIGLLKLNNTYTQDTLNTTNINFSLTTTNSTVLTAWQTAANQDLRIRGRFVDYFNQTTIDEINYTNVWIAIAGKKWLEIGNHTETNVLNWNTTLVPEENCIDLRARAIDLTGSNTSSSYFTKGSCLNISRNPAITNPVLNATIVNQSDTVRLNVTITDELSIIVANVTLLYPNGTSENFSLTYAGGDMFILDFSDTNATGTYNFTNIIATDALGNTNNTVYTTLNFQVTVSPPTPFNLLTPANNTVSTNHQPNMSWEKTNETHFTNYTLILDKDSAFGSPDFTYVNFQIDNTSRVLDSLLDNNSIYYWRVTAYDVFGNSRQSTNDFVYITDNLTTAITLNTPPNNSFVTVSSFQFNYTPTDNNLANCSLYTNQTGSFGLNQTNSSPVSGQPNLFNSTLNDGTYIWNVFCVDRANNSDFVPANFTVRVDTISPNVTLEGPANNTLENATNNIVFNYSVTDLMTTVGSCEVIVDGTVEDTDISITEGVFQNFTVFVGNGKHNWSVNCTDANGFEGSSDVYNLTVNVTSESDPPVVTLNFPKIDDFLATSSVTFNYTPNDASGIENCTFFINNQVNQTNTTVTNMQPNLFTAGGFSDQEYSWRVQCYDNSSFALGTSSTRNFTVDLIDPAVVLNTPLNNTVEPASSVVFNYTPTDTNLNNCSLYANFSGSFTEVENKDDVVSGIPNNFTRNVADGYYAWNVFCYDSANRTMFALNNYSVRVDATPPAYFNISADPTSPTTYSTPQTYFFNVTWVDDTLDTILLEHNFTGALQNTTLSSGNTIFTFNVSNLSAGSYAYKWYANDTQGKTNETSQFTYTVQKAASEVNLTLNGTRGNLTIDEDSFVNITSLIVTPASGDLSLFLDGVLINNGSSPLTNITFFADPGAFNVTARYNQTQNYTGSFETHFVLVNDTTPPVVNLMFPANNQTIGNIVITFEYNVSDSINVANCSLFINGTFNQSDDTITKDTTQTFTETFMNGTYNWRVDCVDLVGNLGQSVTNNFTVQETSNIVVNTSSDKILYQEGEIANVTILTKDIFSNAVETNTTTDVIYAQGSNTTTPWWNTGWKRRKPIFMNNSGASDKVNSPIVLNVTSLGGSVGNCNELRIAKNINGNNFEIDSGIRSGDDNDWCEIIFLANVSASATNENNYFVYYNNSGVGAGSYSTDPAGSGKLILQIDFENVSEINNWAEDASGPASPNGLIEQINSSHPFDNSPAFTTHSGTWVLAFADDTIDLLAFGNRTLINLSGYNNVSVSMWKAEESTEADDQFQAYYWNGTGWVQMWSDVDATGNGVMSAWAQFNNSIPDTVPREDFFLQIRWETSIADPGEHMFIDDINVTGMYNNTETGITHSVGQEKIHINRTTEQTNMNGQFNFLFDTLTQQTGNYSVVTLAEAGGFKNGTGSSVFQLTPDTTPPNITLNLPVNAYNTSNTTTVFNWTANDYQRNQTCNLTIDGAINESNVSIDNNANVNITVIGFSEGKHNWNVTCVDSKGNVNTSETRTFTTDLTPPSVQLNIPVESFNTTSTSINFNWTAIDVFDPAPLCNVSIDSVVQAANVVSTNNTPTNQTISSINTGTRLWNVTCKDATGNVDTGTTRTFVVLASPPNITIELLNLENVFINWTPVVEAISYNVYFADNLTLGFSGPANVTGLTATNYTDTAANQTTRRFYKVSSVRGSAENNMTVFPGKYDTQLETGFNLVSFPLTPNDFPLKNSTNNGYEFPLDPPCLMSLWRYNTTGFERTDWNGAIFTPAGGSEGFTRLNVSRGYWLEANSSCELTFVGIVPTQKINISLANGFTLVSWHSAEEKELPTNSDPVLINVSPQNAVQTIDRYNASSGKFEVTVHFEIGGTPWGWFPSFNNQEFLYMDPTLGYYFDTTPAANWQHEP